jgi:CheY-like chemotaxis protein
MALPDVILLDVNMPVMDGCSFLAAFYKLPIPNIQKVQIIIVELI